VGLPGPFESREFVVVPTVRVQRLPVGGTDDIRGHALAPLVIFGPDDRHLVDAFVFVEDILHLGRVDVLAAGDDHIVDPVDEKQVAVLVEVARIAGKEPAVTECVCGLLREPPVLAHPWWAVEDGLTSLPLRDGIVGGDRVPGSLRFGRFHDPDLVVRGGTPDTSQLVSHLLGADERRTGTHLGHSVRRGVVLGKQLQTPLEE
jgi:hypothetical protein